MSGSSARDLEDFLIAQIPVAKALGVSVTHVSEAYAEISAPLDKNRNHIGTAFGGSLNSVLLLTCYAWLYNALRERGHETHVVLKSSQIDYLAPVDGDFKAICRAPSADTFAQFIRAIEKKHRARIELSASIIVNGKEACRLTGEFVGLLVL